MISIRAVKGWGLRVLQPIDIRYGVDLRHRGARRWLMQKLDKWNPRLAVVEFPCTFWSILQSNVNYKDRPEELQALQEAERPFIRLVKDIFRDQRRRGGHALAENPATASSWKEPEIEELRAEFYETTSCMCQFGMIGKDGLPMLKRVRWLATDPIFIDYLNKQCNYEHQHEPVAGQNTSLSAQYPPDLADAIIRAYLEVVRKEDFGVHHEWQVMETRHVNYVDVNKDEAMWRPLLAQAEEVLARKVQNSCFLDMTSDLYQKIIPLVPWQIMNVQISHVPKAKRLRPGLENCHRCSVLLQNDDKILIETEHLPTAQAPRERFISPVKVGILVLGHAPGEPQDPAPAHRDQRVQPVPQPAHDGEVVADPLEEPMQEVMAQQGLVRQDYASGECWFIGAPLRHEQRRLAPGLVRMHRNLGHPRNEDFVRALAQHGKVDPEAVALARRLRCASCERTKRPLPPRPTSLKTIGGFNDKVCLDFLFMHDINQEKHTYLHVLDPAGGYNVFIWVPSRNPDVVFDAFTTAWASWAGYPRTVLLDRDGGFAGSFSDNLELAGTEIETIAAEAHWQAGEVESYNRAFKFVASRLIDEKQLAGEEHMKMLGAMVGAAMNDKVRTCGASPNQWLFGRNPRVPEDLLSPDGQLEALRGLDQDQQLRLRSYVRAQADVALSQFRIDDALRKAVLRQGRPTRLSYEPGELVAFWRHVKKKKGKILQPGWFRGTIVGPHKGDGSPGQSNYWVTSGGRLILVSKEQLRPTYGTEQWRIQDADLENILAEFPEEYYDETGEPPPEDMVMEAFAEDDGEVVVPMYAPSVSYTPSLASTPEEAASGVQTPLGTDTTQPPTIRAPGTPVQGLFRGEHRLHPEHQPPGQDLRAQRPGHLPDAELPPVPDDPEFEGAGQPEEQVQEPNMKRARLDLGDEAQDNLYPEDDNLPTYEEEMQARAHSALWGVRLQTPNGTRTVAATRKEMKALEKELPWDMIPEDQRPGYEAALQKEWDTWKKYQAVEPLDLEASAWVEENVPKNRILQTRVCYRNKNAAYPWMPVKEKARLVCRGDRDPDLLSLRRDAPTLTRVALMMILQIAASFADWFLFNSDITGAFLQGDQSLASRREALYLRQPREGLPGLLRGQLMLVVRGIFGLANSPRLFWRHLRDTLLKMGFIQSTLDRALFMFYKANRLVLVMGAHVDDLIGAGAPGEDGADGILQQLRETFDFGSWADSRTDGTLEYGGKQITREGRIVKLNQKKFVQAATLTTVPKWRAATPNAELMPKEHTELRSLGGCLHWLVGQTRPDLAAATSLYMGGKPTVNHLVQLNKLVREAKSSEDWGLTFQPIDLEKAKILVFSDSSWANAAELKSQAGFMVFVAGAEVCQVRGDMANLVDWRSHRIKRQCRSTLAAETMAMDAAMDAGIFARELLGEILIKTYHPVHSGRLPCTFMPVVAATDCRSLYDLLVKDGPLSATQEKRLAIDLVGLKEAAAEFDPEQEKLKEVFHWVATDNQLADHLTKVKPSHLLRELLSQGHVALQVET